MATTRIDIEGSASGFLNASKQAENALGRIQTQASRATRSLDGISRSADLMGNALKTAFAAAVGSSLFNFIDGLQNMQNKLRIATNSQEEFNQANAAVKAIADKTGQSLGAIGDLYSKVAMNADKLGYSQAQVTTVTNAFATALQVSGASAQGSASSIYQFSQILAKGKVNGDEFTTIMENLGGPVMDLVAKNMGVSTAELIKLKEKGLIGAKDFTDALIRSMDQLAVMGGKVAPTVGQALQRIQNGFASFLLELEKSTGVFDKTAKLMDFLAKNIDAVVFAAGTMFAVFAVGRILAVAREVQMLAASMGILQAVMSVISRNPIVLMLTGIASFAAYMAGKELFGNAPEQAGDLARATAEANAQISQTPGQLTGVSDKYKEIIRDLKEQLSISSLYGDELSVQSQLLTYNRQLERQMTADQRAKLEGLLKEIEANKRLASIRQTIADMGVQTGAKAGQKAAGDLGQLDPVKKAIADQATMFNGLDYLRQQDLISEQTYQTAKINAAVAANQAIMEATKKNYESQAMLRIQAQTGSQFGYETQKQMAAEAAAFEMKSNQEKYAFALDQASQMFSALGSQNKKAFEAAKAFNIANAIMNTYMAATKAFAMYGGWPFGAIAAAATVAMGMAQVNAIRSQQYSGRQLGGPVMGNQPYIVGENGPELFVPNTTGSITRNGDLGGGTTNVNFTIQTNDAQGFDDLLIQRRGMITQFIKDAMQEQGQRSKM